MEDRIFQYLHLLPFEEPDPDRFGIRLNTDVYVYLLVSFLQRKLKLDGKI
jgi:hypothetical protein